MARPSPLSSLSLALAGVFGGACAPAPDLRLAAAASLSEVLPPLLAEFEAAHGLRVEAVYGGSGALVAQFRHGAPFDALFLAGPDAARPLVERGELAVAAPALVHNTIVLVGRAGGPAAATSGLAAVWKSIAGNRVAIGGDAVPAGAYARAWLAAEGVALADCRLVPFEHVRAVLAAVRTGSCAAGFAYASDCASDAALVVLAWPAAETAVEAGYPFLVARRADERRASHAQLLADFLQERGASFVAAGFHVGDAPAGAGGER